MKKYFSFVSLLVMLSSSVFADPGIQIGATRLVYNESDNQASVDINNTDNKPYLIQSWLTNINGDEHATNNNFVTTPPLFKLEGSSSNSVRIVQTGNSLPTDRETALWLNVKAIPSQEKTENNTLTIAIKTKIKVFYRPEKLKNLKNDAWNKISFREKNGKLNIVNPTPFNISFNTVKVNNVEIPDMIMVEPFSEKVIDKNIKVGQAVSWNVINDYGGITEEKTVKIENK